MTLSTQNITTFSPISVYLLNCWKECADLIFNDLSFNSPKDFYVEQNLRTIELIEFGGLPQVTGYEDKEEVTANAAYGIAAILIQEKYALSVVTRTAKGEGVDLVLSDSTTVDSKNFLQPLGNRIAKMEVKGTRTSKYVKQRLSDGIRQSKPAQKLGKVYIVSIDFETPGAFIAIKP